MVKGSLRLRGVLPLVAGKARFTREKGSLRSRETRNARIAMLLLKTVFTETESRLPTAQQSFIAGRSRAFHSRFGD
jgi:hypothetical protein